MSLVLTLTASLGAAFAADGPQAVEERERERLMQLLAQIDLPAVESFGAPPASSRTPPPSMAGLPARQHEIEEQTKN